MLALTAEAGAALTLTQGTEQSSLQLQPQIVVNAMPMLRQLLMEGCGVALVPEALVQADLQRGDLRPVLPGWRAGAVEAHLLYRSRSLLPKRVRLLVEHLVQAFG